MPLIRPLYDSNSIWNVELKYLSSKETSSHNEHNLSTFENEA